LQEIFTFFCHPERSEGCTAFAWHDKKGCFGMGKREGVAQDGRGRGVQHDLGKDARGQESLARHARGGDALVRRGVNPLDKTEILDKAKNYEKIPLDKVLRFGIKNG